MSSRRDSPPPRNGIINAVKLIAREVHGPIIAGLCRANAKDIRRAAEALAPAARQRIHIFIATSDIHMEFKLRKTREEVLAMAVQAVELARTLCEDVEFSAEDATRSDVDFLCRVIEAVIDAGATTVNIPGYRGLRGAGRIRGADRYHSVTRTEHRAGGAQRTLS